MTIEELRITAYLQSTMLDAQIESETHRCMAEVDAAAEQYGREQRAITAQQTVDFLKSQR